MDVLFDFSVHHGIMWFVDWSEIQFYTWFSCNKSLLSVHNFHGESTEYYY